MTLHFFLHFCHTMHSCLARRWRRRCGRRRSRRTRTSASPASLVLPVDTAFGRMCSDLLSALPRALETAARKTTRCGAREEDDERIFKPFTDEYLGLSRTNYLRLVCDLYMYTPAAVARSSIPIPHSFYNNDYSFRR